MLLMMLDELDGSRERLASRDPDSTVGTPFDDVVMDAADVDDRKGEVTLMVGLFAKDEETLCVVEMWMCEKGIFRNEIE